jgi:hypothetical protein
MLAGDAVLVAELTQQTRGAGFRAQSAFDEGKKLGVIALQPCRPRGSLNAVKDCSHGIVVAAAADWEVSDVSDEMKHCTLSEIGPGPRKDRVQPIVVGDEPGMQNWR